MPEEKKNLLWYYARSLMVMAILLLPVYFLSRWVNNFGPLAPYLSYFIETLYSPVVMIFNILCEAMNYCINRQYQGLALMVPLYLASVMIYGYLLALIWSWVSFPKINKPKLPPLRKNDNIF